MKKISISVALIGSRMHYAVPKFLYKNGNLQFLYTDFYFKDKLLNIFKILNEKIYKKLSLRNSNNLSDIYVKAFYSFGFRYRINKYMTRKFKSSLGNLWVWAGTNFNKNIISDIKKLDIKPDIVYGYNSASKELFFYCKQEKIITILEQCSAPMIYENNIMHEEYLAYSNWEIELYQANMNCEEFMNREDAEWDLADLIIVPSQYVKNTLINLDVTSEKIKVVPYGYDAMNVNSTTIDKVEKKNLNVLYVGGLRLQKGIQYFYELSKTLPSEKFEFRAVGENFLKENTFSKIKHSIGAVGKILRSEMHMQYKWADILVVPSLSEGSATVIYEALSYGVPVICTENAGSVITNGKDGYIVEIRDVEKMKEYLISIADNNKLLELLKIEAKKTSSLYTVEKYGDLLLDTIQDFYKMKGKQ